MSGPRTPPRRRRHRSETLSSSSSTVASPESARRQEAERAAEARAINKSLAALGTVLRMLAAGSTSGNRGPRESKSAAPSSPAEAGEHPMDGADGRNDSSGTNSRELAGAKEASSATVQRKQKSAASQASQAALRASFRACALTRVLQGSLASPGSRVLVIGCVSPSFDAQRESLATLQFVSAAARMRSIQGLPPGVGRQDVSERVMPSPPRRESRHPPKKSPQRLAGDAIRPETEGLDSGTKSASTSRPFDAEAVSECPAASAETQPGSGEQPPNRVVPIDAVSVRSIGSIAGAREATAVAQAFVAPSSRQVAVAQLPVAVRHEAPRPNDRSNTETSPQDRDKGVREELEGVKSSMQHM